MRFVRGTVYVWSEAEDSCSGHSGRGVPGGVPLGVLIVVLKHMGGVGVSGVLFEGEHVAFAGVGRR